MSKEGRESPNWMPGKLSRRAFARRMSLLALSGAGLTVLQACGGAPPAAPAAKAPPTTAAPAAATVAPAAPAAKGGGVLTIGMEAEVPNLDPGQSLGLHSGRVSRLINETLVTTKPLTTEIVPLLAKSWETSPDGKEWTFRLQENARFTDGTPLTAEAVKQTFERTIKDSNPYYKSGKWSFAAGYLAPLEEAVAINDQTVKLVLKYPLASLLGYLALPNLGIMSLKALQEDSANVGSKPVGTGPYMVSNWERGTRLELARNENYWGTKGTAERIVFRPFVESQARVAALLAGEADVIIPVPPDSIQQIDSSGRAQVVQQPGLTIWYVSFDLKKKPFDDVRVRQALNYAVDKEAIVRDVLKGTGTVAQGPIPPSWAFNPAVEKYAYDPEKAKRLLAEAGYPNGFSARFWVPDSGSGMQEPKPMASVIQANLAAVGVRTSIEVFEWGSYLSKLQQELPEMAALSWFLKSDDPDLSLYPLLYSKNAPLPNRAGYNNPEVDDLLVKARSTTNQEERTKLYHQILEIATNDAPWIFVDHQQEIIGVRNGVEGVTINPNGYDLRAETAKVG